jgi:glycosyltransferase involved in cell wall biosynthesis
MSGGGLGFSIIVPVFAPPWQLDGCLEAISQLSVPEGGLEVIVVDDGSPEPMDEVVEKYGDRLCVKLVRQSNSGPGAARNAGARIARGTFLAFTDADCQPAPDWLTTLAHRFRQTPAHMLGGHTVNRLTGNPYATTSQLIVDAVYEFYNREPGAARFFSSNNLAVPAQVFHEIGGFDRTFFRHASEDRELCDRWRHGGHQMLYAPEAVVYHAHALTLSDFCRQHFTYGRGAWHYREARARRGSGRLREDMEFHARLIPRLGKPLAKLPRGCRWSVPPLLALWQAFNAAGFFYEACRSRDVVRGKSSVD